MNHHYEIIALDSSSEDEDDPPLIDLEDWESFTPSAHGNIGATVTFDPETQYQRCLASVVEMFPDVSKDHVRKLYQDRVQSIALDQAENAAEVLISEILDAKSYPKEKDRLNDLKRKRADGEVDDESEALKWKSSTTDVRAAAYQKISRTALQESFPLVPLRYIDAKFKEHGHLYATYLDIADSERRYTQLQPPPYPKLKARRLFNGLNHDDLLRRIRQKEGVKGDKVELEIQAAHERRLRDDDAYDVEDRKKAVALANEQIERDKGEVLECGCCFDTIPMSKVTQCNAEVAHFFCLECARSNAENDVGMNRFALICMDGSGCRATFSRMERVRFLDERTLVKLDSLEQQASIQGAMSELFDFVTCPFCEYGHICPPVEEDKEFRCGFPDCREVSCRLCRERTHIPMTCEEYKRDQGISERHIIEEARTEALLRSCPKCKVRILKEDGCNKVICTTCRSAICDFCGQDITKEQYAHFEGREGPIPVSKVGGRCPLYDQSNDRKDKQVGAAEKQAKESIRKENPEISEEDLEIRFSEEVRKKGMGEGEIRHPYDRVLPNVVRRHPYIPRRDAFNGDLDHQLNRLIPGPDLQPVPLPNQPFRPGAQPLQQGLRLPPAPHPPVARAATANQQPNNQLDDIYFRARLDQLEQEALVRGQRMQALRQVQMARLQEQQAQTARHLRAQTNALRQALPGFLDPVPPQIPAAPVHDPWDDPFDVVGQWLPGVHNAPREPRLGNNERTQGAGQPNAIFGARRHRPRAP